MLKLPAQFPATGLGDEVVGPWFEEQIRTRSTALGSTTAFAHMDPPTPDLAATLVGLNAQHNQNLLHPDLSPFATEAEAVVIDWLAPAFGMQCGHLCSGSTLANLTALWCARESGATRVVASVDAHISVAKSAHLLGLPMTTVAVDAAGRLDRTRLGDCSDAAVVLTAGTTGRGVIDDLGLTHAAWTHVDAAWAGPLRYARYASRLDGIECADSVAISAHKWFYQPKDSALVLFADSAAQERISFGSSYLSVANVGVQGSRGAAAIPLLATLLAWGQEGLAARIEKNMDDAMTLARFIESDFRSVLKQRPETGVVNWRPKALPVGQVLAHLDGVASSVNIDGDQWLRHVAANPNANVQEILSCIDRALSI